MSLPTFHLPLSTLANQLPDLPEGPSLENIRGPVELGSWPETWQIALIVLTVGLTAGLLMWFLLRSGKHPGSSQTPGEAALSELEAAKLANDDERFALLCANAVRNYLGARYNLTASSLTSAELYARLRLPKAAKDRIREFLNRCDGVKFAGEQLSADLRIQIVDTASSIIATQERKEPPPL